MDIRRDRKLARVKLLVLSHAVPAEDPTVTDQTWICGSLALRGEIIVGQDLMEI